MLKLIPAKINKIDMVDSFDHSIPYIIIFNSLDIHPKLINEKFAYNGKLNNVRYLSLLKFQDAINSTKPQNKIQQKEIEVISEIFDLDFIKLKLISDDDSHKNKTIKSSNTIYANFKKQIKSKKTKEKTIFILIDIKDSKFQDVQVLGFGNFNKKSWLYLDWKYKNGDRDFLIKIDNLWLDQVLPNKNYNQFTSMDKIIKI